MPAVDVVYEPGCPNMAAARANLMRAFASAGVAARWQEHAIGDPAAPPRVRGYGSPTILVDGRDVAGEAPGAEACCRLYPDGAPATDAIVRALRAAAATLPPVSPGRLRSMLAALPGVLVALMPKLACPLCWPAYAAVLGALGVPFLMQARWLLPISAALLALALGAIAWRARARRGYRPLGVALAGATTILAGKFALDSNAVMDAGVAIFVAASVWNAWPRRRRAACSACETETGSETERSEEPWQGAS